MINKKQMTDLEDNKIVVDDTEYLILNEKSFTKTDNNGNTFLTVVKYIKSVDTGNKQNDSFKRALKKYRDKNLDKINKKINSLSVSPKR